MSDRKTLISIGMPVYNGETHLCQALDSLLAQSYEDFEIHISDNASTDRTGEICRSYRSIDKRVHYHYDPNHVGVLANYHRALNLTSSEYFMWAAADDCWSANYVETLMECLLARPEAALAAGRTLYIDGKGNRRTSDPDDAPARNPGNGIITARQLLEQHAAGWLHGVYRRDPLLKSLPTFLTTHPWGSDVVFLLELCLTSEVTGSDTAVMYKRVSDLNNSHVTLPKTPRQIVGWQCGYAAALMRVILNSPISAKEKQDLIKTYFFYLKRLYFWSGITTWLKTWIRAGGHWLVRIDRT